ncbi:MAG: c-type cytochrome [Sulfuritalea sp.]|nr:c-type cytochrome [Sulfuritalea sp.]
MNRKIVMLLAIPFALGAAAVQSAETAGKKEAAPAAKSAAPAPAATQNRSAEFVVNSTCIECHGTGKLHSPRIGDRDDWVKRASKGLDALVLGAIRGHTNMPARGGRPDLTDAEFKAAIFYMFTKTVSAPDKK